MLKKRKARTMQFSPLLFTHIWSVIFAHGKNLIRRSILANCHFNNNNKKGDKFFLFMNTLKIKKSDCMFLWPMTFDRATQCFEVKMSVERISRKILELELCNSRHKIQKKRKQTYPRFKYESPSDPAVVLAERKQLFNPVTLSTCPSKWSLTFNGIS